MAYTYTLKQSSTTLAKKDIYLCCWGGVGSKSLLRFFRKEIVSKEEYGKICHSHFPDVPFLQENYPFESVMPQTMDWDAEKKHFGGNFVPKINQKTKVIYMFGNPYNAVMSYYRRAHAEGHNWTYIHSLNLRSKYHKHILRGANEGWTVDNYLNNCLSTKDLISGKKVEKRDLLGLENHFDLWTDAQKEYPILYINFEDMWDNLDIIFDFLEINKSLISKFPVKKERYCNWLKTPTNVQEKLIKVYGNLEKKVSKKPTYIKPPKK